MSKDCQLAAVSAEEYRNEFVRDAFINGLSSPSIRQRLLENNQLTVTQAFDKARSLRTAQEHSDAYLNRPNVATITHQAEDNPSPANEPDNDDVILGSTSQRKLCYFCGFSYHKRGQCPARDITCHTCRKKGHFSRVCRSKAPSLRLNKSQRSQAASEPSSSALCSIAAACPASLAPASLQISVKGAPLTALVDSGSSESYINSDTCAKLKLDVYPTTHQVQMASTAMKINSSGFCVADINIGKTIYPSTRLNVLDNICSDVILGLDFQSQHQQLVIKFHGESPDLVVTQDSHCLLTIANTPEVSLFSNLSAMPSRSLLHHDDTIRKIGLSFKRTWTNYLKTKSSARVLHPGVLR